MNRLAHIFSSDRCPPIAFFLFVVSAPAYLLCRYRHFCMAGYLQHPDDFTPFSRASDTLWFIGFILCGIMVFRSDIEFRFGFLFSLLIAFLLFSSPLGIGGILQIPILVLLFVFLLALLLGWI